MDTNTEKLAARKAEWNFTCSCGKIVTVEVDSQSTAEKTREAARDLALAKYGWVGIAESEFISCSAKCWNQAQAAVFRQRKHYYPLWWRRRGNPEKPMPTCECPPIYVTLPTRKRYGRGRRIRLLDGWAHRAECWWRQIDEPARP